MSTHTRAISPKIEQLRSVRRLAWRLIVAFLLIHYAAGAAYDLLFGDPGFLLVKVG
jgi:hypothetical protein